MRTKPAAPPEYEVLNPSGEAQATLACAPSARLPSLAGKVVFCISQVIGGADEFLTQVSRLLPQVAPGVTAVFVRRDSTYMTDDTELWERVGREADAVIYGCAACGSCSMWGTHWTVAFEKRGIPSVFVVDEPFRVLVQTTCEHEGMPALRRVYVPHPCDGIRDEAVLPYVQHLAEALTAPLSTRELSPTQTGQRGVARIAFRGSLEEVNRFFELRDWTDGLPVMPPTQAAVATLLEGTQRAASDTVVERLHPEGYRVTVEKVATVGAMANCLPQHMPILLAIVQALAAPTFASCIRSATSFSLVTIVGGPAARRAAMNARGNALGAGTGNSSNACIGRFTRLALICLGGLKTGVSDLSSLGHPAKYSFAFTENVDDSPWEPWHVGAGFGREEGVVTIMYGGWNCLSPFARFMTSVPLGLQAMARGIAQFELPRGALLLLDPIVARKLADAGYSKQGVARYLWEHSTRPAGSFRDDHFYSAFMEHEIRGKGAAYQARTWPRAYLSAADAEEIRVYPEDSIEIMVVGGKTNPLSQAWQFYNPVSVRTAPWE